MRFLTVRFFTLVLALLVVIAAEAKTQEVKLAELFPTERQTRTLLVINKVLERFHYRDMTLNRDFAAQVLDNYFTDLDPNRSFFHARDVKRFKDSVGRLHEDLRRGKIDIAFDIFRVYRLRIDQSIDNALKFLDQEFDFERRETHQFDRSEAPWAANDTELRELWRKRVKNDALTLRLAGKSDEVIRTQLRNRYQGIARRIHQFKSDDVYQAFINSLTRTLEPHTSYMSPSTSENFDISMRLSLEGIGAVLRADNEHTVVQRTVPGGPARQSGQIHTGDKIIGVAQGIDGAMEDIVGWRLQDVVDKIRGPKGSVVRLQILPKSEGTLGGRMREVTVVRNEITLEDQAASTRVIEGVDNAPDLRIGVLEVPAFYRDFRAESEGTRDFRSTTRDVRQLIGELVAEERIDGLIIDLRGNGGGSLTEATSLTGLFIKQGPVVQVKDSFGKIEVETDPDPEIVYAGPLVVIVDRNSASASEIFAGAIQDYGRGLIVGEPTFGKGTVQTLIDLNRYVPTQDGDLGRLRLTMAEFFRISGASTQLRGVEPDIHFDFGFDISKHGERGLDNPLPWGRIQPAPFDRHGTFEVARLRSLSTQRTSQDDGFQMLTAQGRLLTEIDKQRVVSLREADRRAESEHRDRILKDEKHRFLRAQGVEPVDEDADQLDEEALERQQKIIEAIQINEAARILADMIRLEQPRRAS